MSKSQPEASQHGPLFQEILYSESQVDARIAEMAIDITQEYKGTKTLFIPLLNGAVPFTAKLMSAIQRYDPYFHPNAQTMVVSRYGPNREPGEPRVVADLPPDYRDLTGLHVVLLDDLIEGGGTTEHATQHLQGYNAKEIDRIVLVRKLRDPPVEGNIAMVGFDNAPDVWLTGMGMDDNHLAPEANRWAGYIAVANAA
jgi:hypoxanthine phosphoribosyltransferase